MEFYRRNCSRPRVFDAAYVRCFPHCSPSCCPHSQYRGCGASVSVRIAEVDANAVAMARFRSATNDPTYVVGDTLVVDPNDVRSSFRPRAQWLRGSFEAESRSFTFNEKRRFGWHYDWQSSSSSLKRSEQHVFQVYLCQAVGDRLVVVAMIASPPFTISSYRRAKQGPAARASPLPW
ncbi:hypothetical protein ACHHYP_06241, partial [Achlya hypogyna]